MRQLHSPNAAECYSHASVTARHRAARVSAPDRLRPVRRATHLPSRQQPSPDRSNIKFALHTQFCDAQRSLGDRPLLVLLGIPGRPGRTHSARLPTALRTVIPAQLAHLRLEALHKHSKPCRPTKHIVGVPDALQTRDVGLERLVRHADLLTQSTKASSACVAVTKTRDGKGSTHFSIEASTSSKPRRTDNSEPESLLALDACANRSSWCAVTYPPNTSSILAPESVTRANTPGP